MADTGYRNPTVGQSIVISGGDKHWSNPTRIYTSNNSYASANLYADEKSHWLRAKTFGFSIPGDATINGITVQIERRGSRTDVRDNSVKIVKAGSASGTEKKVYTSWPGSDAYQTYGGSTDKWGLTWTPAQINATNFGVGISAKYIGIYISANAYVDHIRIKVYYTPYVPPLPDMKVNISDTFRQVSEIKLNVGDVWRTVTEVWINIGDVWRQVF